jgi:hypothetical protein
MFKNGLRKKKVAQKKTIRRKIWEWFAILVYNATDLALNGCTSAEPSSFLTAKANIIIF